LLAAQHAKAGIDTGWISSNFRFLKRPDTVTMTPFPFRKAHFIGLAGVGMSATAILLRDSGVAVTGSDEAIYPPISQVLAREAFACRAPYAAQNIPDDADLIVIGKNARGEDEAGSPLTRLSELVRRTPRD
jgi:UDP-N-acetylmuramate-alanine ligase